MGDNGETHRNTRSFSLNKDTLISFSLAIAIGGTMFIAGSIYEKISRLDGLGLERRVSRMEIILGLVAKNVGVPADLLADIRADPRRP